MTNDNGEHDKHLCILDSELSTSTSVMPLFFFFQAARAGASDEQRAEDAARLLALAEAEVAAEEASIVDEADTRGEEHTDQSSVQRRQLSRSNAAWMQT